MRFVCGRHSYRLNSSKNTVLFKQIMVNDGHGNGYLQAGNGGLKQFLPFLLLVVFSIPLFFLNIHNGHSWGGDDYAQYIKEAENIAKGKPYYQSGYVFYDRNICYAPPQYPPGFPLLLAPVVKIWGLAIQPMCYFNTVLLLAFMLVAFAWLRKQMSVQSAFCITLLMAYGWVLVDIKQSVWSDLPCLLFTMLYILYRSVDSFKPWRLGLLVLFAAMAILIRTQSVMILGAEIILIFFGVIRDLYGRRRISRSTFLPGAFVVPGVLVLNVLVTRLVFPAPSTASGFYVNYLQDVLHTGIITIFRNNVNFFVQALGSFFFYETDNGFRTAMVTFMQGTGMILCVTGFLIQVTKRLAFEDAFFVLMVVLMLYYPIHDSRYFLPVIAIVYYYCYVALCRVLPAITKLPIQKIGIAITLIVLFTGLKYLKGTLDQPLGYVPEAKDYAAFNYIKQHVNDTDIILFSRPRLLSLYTGKRCMVQAWLLPMEENHKIFDSLNVKYALTVKGLADDFNNRYLSTVQRPIDSVVISEGYTLYRLR